VSEKIRVGAVVGEAFEVGAKRWPALIRFFLLPVLVGGLLFCGVMAGMIDFAALRAETHVEDLQSFEKLLRVPLPVFIGFFTAVQAVFLLLISGGAASFFRLVAIGEDRPGLAQLRLDGPAWRVFWSLAILLLISAAIYAAAIAAAASVTGQSPATWLQEMFDFMRTATADGGDAQLSHEKARELFEKLSPLMLAAGFAFIPMLYVGVKLAAFPAASAVEDRIALFQSFGMTFGHWWSILFSFILCAVAIVILLIVVGISLAVLHGVGVALLHGPSHIGGLLVIAVAAILSIGLRLVIAAVRLALPAIIYRRLAG